MDADWSCDPNALPANIVPIAPGDADLVIGSRYARGGDAEDWSLGRRVISWAVSPFARTPHRLEPNDLTRGFEAWRTATFEKVPFEGVPARGYVFQIDLTYRATGMGARVQEVPIHLPRPDRRHVEDVEVNRPRSIDRGASARARVASRTRPISSAHQRCGPPIPLDP